MATPKFDYELLKGLLHEIRPQALERLTDENTRLFQEGILDSYAIIQLVNLLEERFGVTINFQDVKAVNFDTLKTLSSYLNLKFGGGA